MWICLYGGTVSCQMLNSHVEIVHRLNFSNACCHCVEDLLSSSLISRNIKIKIHKTIILSVGLSGCATCSPTIWEGHRLRVFKNRMLRVIF